ncbi:MAG TPA: SGNH/GDSL hydrolase family protein [Gemmatimonadales bacterium]
MPAPDTPETAPGLEGVTARSVRLLPWQRALAICLVLGGSAAILVAAAGDVIGLGGSPGIGTFQVMLGLLGLAVVWQGLAFPSAPEEVVGHWQSLLLRIDAGRMRRFAVIFTQLVLLVVAVRVFQIESPAFYQQIIPLAAFGFIVHHLLPQRHRLPFFAALSMGGVLIVAGTANTLWILGLAIVLIAICHLPIPFSLRLAGLVVIGVTLGLMRSGVILTPWSTAVWPILASLMMFRLVLYVYHIRHTAEKPALAWTLSYFFLLPNVVFPLFPVVDFSTFRRTYYDHDPYLIYQRGFDWILRGCTHLLLYRVIYQYFTIAPEDVETLGQLVHYMVTTFLLYLKVSGQFHVIVGLLHLFGFRLPETNHLYYLASSFSDAWRRINIYWKDFMTKVVFYPTYLRLKGRGDRVALVGATTAVFAVTWFLHAYQWYWLLGSWLIASTDIMFWVVLGAFLAINALRESKRGRTRIIGTWSGTPREVIALGLRTTLTFLTIALLWSLWNSATLGDWFNLLTVRIGGPGDFALLAAVVVLIGGAAVHAARRGRAPGATERAWAAGNAPAMRAWPSVGGLAALCLAGIPGIGPFAGPEAERFLSMLRAPELSTRDVALMERGYYENLNGVVVRNSELWELYAQRAARGATIWTTDLVRQRDDFLGTELRPLHTEFQPGIVFSTNRWGMRDKDYEPARPANAYRIALLGASHVAGDGVSDGQTFETLVENRLNQEYGPRVGRLFEILNFGVGAYSIPQQLLTLDRVFSFDPDALYFVATPGDGDQAALHLVKQIRRDVRPPFPYLDSLLTGSGVTPHMAETEALQRLAPYQDDIVRWGLSALAAACAARDVKAVWVYLYLPESRDDAADAARLETMARAAGFTTLNLRDVYGDGDLSAFWASPFDHHPNARGHQVIAERLFAELTARDNLDLPVGAVPETPTR